ncbi:MAG: hypothetical protein HY824_05160 [Acidobacteria bacterium]|nr:hypothetical protein [Acidobacteriota bacterium]
MNVLFCALHFSYYRNFESVVRALAARGHRVHLAADEPETMGGAELVERLAAELPGVTWGFTPRLDEWTWMPLSRAVRRGLEFVRFLDPRYERIVKYRARTRERAASGLVRLLGGGRGRSAAWRGRVARVLAAIERGIPTPPVMDAFIAERAPDVVLLASVTNPGALQLDHQKSAMAAGRRCALTIFSWDHLSGKAWLKLFPERVIVWNDIQKAEATDLHGIPPDRVVVTGAQCYDQWFDRHPSRSREQFCDSIGLDPSKPILLYVCSVLSRPAPAEAPFVLDWIRALRESDDPVLRQAGVLIRPHPERLREWNGLDLASWPNVALSGRNPVDAQAKADYFDSLYYASAVVGLVTSAFVEAAVVGRPTLTIETSAFTVHQEGTTHFGYLADPATGVLLTAPDFDTHVRQLSDVLAHPGAAAARTRAFVERFVRPHGLERRATDRFVETVESLGEAPAPDAVVFGAGRGRLVAGALCVLAAQPGIRTLFLSETEIADERQRAAHEADGLRIKAERRTARQEHLQSLRLAKQARQAQEADVKMRRRAERELAKAAKRRATDERRRVQS